MKQKDWFWCGAVFLALVMFISLQSIQEPLYAGIAGGLCALMSAILFGCGLRASAQEKSAIESKHMEEEQKQLEAQCQTHTDDLEHIQSMFDSLKEEFQSIRRSAENEGQAQRERITTLLDYLREWFDAQQQSYTVALNQLQTDITAVTEEIRTLRKAIASESQSYSKAFAQFSKDVRECSESDQIQTKESAKSICDSILEQHTALCKVLESQGKESTNYYKFMVDQPWDEVKTLSRMLQSIDDQAGSILSVVDTIPSDTKQHIKNALDKLREDSGSLQEKLQYVCETMEKQGKESRDAMDRVMQGYSDITAQDIEVLTALTRDARV